MFEIPPPDGEYVRLERNITSWRESSKVANACYEYFLEQVRLSESYDRLLNQLADEVFHIVFLNREALSGLNSLIASYVRELHPSDVDDDFGFGAILEDGGGRLKRCSIPSWAQRAVFFRDHGICTQCVG
jgi:hypothetical protein